MTGRASFRESRRLGALTAAVLVGSLATASAQTRVTPDNNKFSVQEDVQIGQEAAAQVRKEMPLLDDNRVDDYVEEIGRRLVDEIPSDFRHDGFRYSFDVVNASDINAFALPGGPMFLNRGMIEAARTEAEVAGVMAHEIAHVALRHGTAQATKAQKFQIGAVAGQILGAIVGGTAGSIISQGSQFGLGTYFLKYGREYEREADLLGAQIMARAGYDPRQMASMFQTIERESGGRGGPEWMSSHPNPGNRVEYINREAQQLQIEGSSGSASEFNSIQSRLREKAPAQTMEQIARSQGGANRPVGTSGNAGNVESPSGQWRTYQPGNMLRLSVPANWQEMARNNTVTYAPQGGFVQGQGGRTAFTHGIEVGVANVNGRNLQDATSQLLQGFAQANPQLRRRGSARRSSIDGREALTTTLTNTSEVTGGRELVEVTTIQLESGELMYLVGVAPEDRANEYRRVFSRVRESVDLAERR